MTVKKTIRLTDHRNEQVLIMSDFLKMKGYKGAQTEVIEKAIMDLYANMRRIDREWFIDEERKRQNPIYERWEDNDIKSKTLNTD